VNFQIETTSYCNLTCPECPNWTMKRPRVSMDLDLFKRIVLGYVYRFRDHNRHLGPPTIIMHKDGEPLLNKRLPDMLEFLAGFDPSLFIDIYSHGLLLTEDFVKLLGNLPNKVRLLVTYHFHNHDGTTNDYTETTRLLRKVLAWGRQNGPEIILATHRVQASTDEEIARWRAIWRPYEATGRVTVHDNSQINPWAGRIDEPNCISFDQCPYDNFGHMFFGATGNVVACCMDLEEDIVLGHVDDDPQEVFTRLTAFYAKQARGEFDHDICRKCVTCGS